MFSVQCFTGILSFLATDFSISLKRLIKFAMLLLSSALEVVTKNVVGVESKI
jgi:hypothetical protein